VLLPVPFFPFVKASEHGDEAEGMPSVGGKKLYFLMATSTPFSFVVHTLNNDDIYYYAI
jgi:hypothetical protein